MNTIVEPTQSYVQMDAEPTLKSSRDLVLLQFIGIGYTALKFHQEEAIIEFVSGKDVLWNYQQTGYGESLCYRCLPCMDLRWVVLH